MAVIMGTTPRENEHKERGAQGTSKLIVDILKFYLAIPRAHSSTISPVASKSLLHIFMELIRGKGTVDCTMYWV